MLYESFILIYLELQEFPESPCSIWHIRLLGQEMALCGVPGRPCSKQFDGGLKDLIE